MKAIRRALTVLILTLLALGYAASQVAALQGWAPRYAAMVDQAPIRLLSLFLLVVVVVFGFIPEREEESK